MYNKRVRELYDRTETLLDSFDEPAALFERDASPEVIQRYQLALNHMRAASGLLLYCTVDVIQRGATRARNPRNKV